jgi:hypothetical protein
MADMFEPVRLRSEEFSELVSGLEMAFSHHAAALVTDERLPSAEVQILDWEETGLNEEAVNKYREITAYLDQMILFAFADAPDQVISEWASSYDASLKDEALKRVGAIRTNMPSLRSLWDAKTLSVIPVLGSVAYEVVTTEGEGDNSDRTVILSISATKINSLGRVERNFIRSITVRLWPSDLILLKQEIDHALEAHFNEGQP